MMEPWFTDLPFFYYFDFGAEEVWYSVRFEKDTRYYVIRLEQDLFEHWTINAINGRIKSKLGQSRILAFDSFEAAFDAFCEMAKIRYQHQYGIKSFFTKSIILKTLIPFILHKIPVVITFKKKKERITGVRKKPEKTRKMPSAIIHEQMHFSF